MSLNTFGFLAIILPFLLVLSGAFIVLARSLNIERKRSDEIFQQLLMKERFHAVQSPSVPYAAPYTPTFNPRPSTVSDQEGVDMPGDFNNG